MRVYVDELPKEKNECAFYEDEEDRCRVCGKQCHIEQCTCLSQLVVLIETEENSEYKNA